jgi:hypothetical protein
MPNSESKARLTVRMNGGLEHTTSWARVLEDGRIELEFFDFSSTAQDCFGNDVAWMYRIDASHRPQLLALLEKKTGTAIPDDQAMLDAFAAGFRDAWAVRDWLKDQDIPYDEEFDSWA